MKNPAPLLFVALAVVGCAQPASAQVPLGPEFRVNTLPAYRTLMGERTRDVAMSADGRFIVAWDTPYAVPFGMDIAARRFDSVGRAAGADFIVNSAYPSGWQNNQSVAADAAGNFVIVWNRTGPSTLSVLGQRFDREGMRLGSEFTVSSASAYGYQPFVAMRPTGEFAVVWKGVSGVQGRRFDASGLPQGSEFQVSAAASYDVDGPSLDFDAAGNFVVAWESNRLSSDSKVFARLFAAAGSPLGPEFRVDGGTLSERTARARVARAGDGSFVVAWLDSYPPSLVARRFDPAGLPVGSAITIGPVNGSSLDLDVDADGDWVVVWQHDFRIFGKRFDAAGASGADFEVSGAATQTRLRPSVSADPAGNFVVVWRATPVWPAEVVMARRYAGGLSAAGLAVDSVALPSSDGNGVLEAGETVAAAPSWLNANFSAQTFAGTAASFAGPGAPGDPTYTIVDGAANYGTVAVNATGSCGATSDCYTVGVTVPTTRPAVHWDASFHEDISPANLGAAKTWAVHVGDSFTDVARASAFYRFVETLLHHNVTNGCTTSTFCPSSSVTREQMAVFVLVAKEGSGYAPPACTTPVFNDVPATSPFCPWIEELARRGVVNGCGGGNYCPAAAVSREQMAVFVLATKEPGVTPPGCGTPRFNDVPSSSAFCPWIEELARRNVVTGCGGGNYCPAAAVTREQMAVFISAGFGLQLYGP